MWLLFSTCKVGGLSRRFAFKYALGCQRSGETAMADIGMEMEETRRQKQVGWTGWNTVLVLTNFPTI